MYIMNQVDKIKAKRILTLSDGSYNFKNSNKSDTDFIKYYKEIVDFRPEYERKVTVYKHLCLYIKKKKIKEIKFDNVNERFLGIHQKIFKGRKEAQTNNHSC